MTIVSCSVNIECVIARTGLDPEWLVTTISVRGDGKSVGGVEGTCSPGGETDERGEAALDERELVAEAASCC